MSNNLELTAEIVEEITEQIKSEASEISYAISLPSNCSGEQGVLLVWNKIVESESDYIDSFQDHSDIEGFLREMGVEVDEIVAVNKHTEIEPFYFGEDKAISLFDFEHALRRAILSDLGSAWVGLIRETIEDITGEDPLGGNDGLKFV